MSHLPESAKRFQKPWDILLPLGSRLTVWGLFFWALFVLRSFFLLIFLTFVFAYIQHRAVLRLGRWIRNRPARVVLVGALFLGVIIAAGLFLVPKVKAQAERFTGQMETHFTTLDRELLRLSYAYPLIAELVPELRALPAAPGDTTGSAPWWRRSSTAAFLLQFIGLEKDTAALDNVRQVFGGLKTAGARIAAVISAFLLALLFSFLIVLDLPQLSRAVASLENTKLRFFYTEVAENVRDFSHVLGLALEAQLLIAVANSVFTAIGIYFLGLGESVAFLTVIVFFCSFIPVAGVFISSAPICLIALQVSGIQTMFLAVLLITAIHLVEAYVLNPRIFGSYMRINPVIVLIILTIAGKLFHVWGLVLGVPVFTYLFGQAIKVKPGVMPTAPSHTIRSQ